MAQRRTKTPNSSPTAACISGEHVAAVMMNCCSVHGHSANDSLLPSSSELKSVGLESFTVISTVEVPKSTGGEGGHGRRGSNLWSEKLTRESRGEADPRRGSPPAPDGPATARPSKLVGAGELLGLALPCTRQHASSVDSRGPGRNGRSTRPFASNPLLDRGDSLVEQPSMLSLIASETEEVAAATAPRNGRMTPPGPGSSCSVATEGTESGSQGKYCSTPLRRLSSGRSQSSVPPPDSPALELSMAKQAANVAQMSHQRVHNREMFRNSIDAITPGKKHRTKLASSSEEVGGEGSAGAGVLNEAQPLVERDEMGAPSMVANGDIDSAETATVEAHTCFQYAPDPPLWKESDGANTELVSTYQYPRLYLRDPAGLVEQGEATQSNKRDFWWFHLAQQMDTTLKHAQEGRWKALLAERNGLLYASDIAGASSSSLQQLPFGCDASLRELCLGQEQQSAQRGARTHRKSSSMSSFGSKPKLMKKSSSGVGNNAASASPVNAWSEPAASTMKVRGRTYSNDGIKVSSEPSIFSVLGVDSFVSQSGVEDDSSSWATDSYLQRWSRACEEVGLKSPPFLLIINFICPWGNFQAYFVRPDADEGPFSSHHKNHPSEKAWRKFVEGTTEYRNERLKLIPRVCAGPWMVKKMVGTTPALLGTKLPVQYRGSVEENYLEITLNVTQGPAFGNSVANTVVGKADVVTVDLGFVIEGNEEDGHLPEQLLGLVRLHHLSMKAAPTHSQWKQVAKNTDQ